MQELMNNPVTRYALIGVLVLLSLFLLVKTIDVFDELGRSNSPMMNTITVQGEGRAAAVPDIARVTYTVMETNQNVATAQEAATAKNDAALEALEKLEIEEKDIRTLSYSVSPQYRTCVATRPCVPTISGYQVSQTVEVKIRATDMASEVLGTLGELGVQNISGPDFTLDDPEAVRAEAREEAIDKAREEAERLAKQLGVRLGKVVSFYDNNMPIPYGYGMGGDMEGAVKAANMPTLPVGESEYTANVSITYEIK